MLESNIKTVRNDMKTLLKDAQDLFREATSTSGVRADELRQRGQALLDSAMVKAQQVQAAALETGKEIALTTDEFVHENPWRAVAIAAGAGLIIGVLVARK